MSAYIKYNNYVFPDPQPYVSVTEEMVEAGGRWTLQTNVDLAGKITGSSSSELYQKRYDIITGLSSSFKKFIVLENTSGSNPNQGNTYADAHGESRVWGWGGAVSGSWTEGAGSWVNADVVCSGHCAKVSDIEFDDSRYASDGGVLGYSISLNYLNSGAFKSGFAYVTDPVDSIEFSEDEGDGTVSVTHTISAKGVNTNSTMTNAMDNAVDFVSSRTGLANLRLPALVPTGEFDRTHSSFLQSMILSEQSESMDRLGGSYSVDESWKYTPYDGTGLRRASSTALEKYSFSISSGSSDEYLTVDTSLEMEGGINTTISNLRSSVPSLDTIWQKATGAANYKYLTLLPNSYSVSESPDAKTLSISVSFDSNTSDYNYTPGSAGAAAWFDYELSFDLDEERNTTTVSVQGDIKMRKNQLYSWIQMKAALDSVNETYLYNIALDHYTDMVGVSASGGLRFDLPHPWNKGFPLNPLPKSLNITEKSGDPSISISASFSDEDFVTGYAESSYDISSTPSTAQFAPAKSALLNGENLISYLGYYNREKINFSLELTPRRSCGVYYTHPHWATWPLHTDISAGMSKVHSIRLVATGAGFQTVPYAGVYRNGQMFNTTDFKVYDNYGVRLEDEKLNQDETTHKLSYSYEYSKPANAGRDVLSRWAQGINVDLWSQWDI